MFIQPINVKSTKESILEFIGIFLLQLCDHTRLFIPKMHHLGILLHECKTV